MASSGAEMEEAEKERRQKRMEERNERAVAREERKAKKDAEEKRAARLKAVMEETERKIAEINRMIEARVRKEPLEEFRDFWMEKFGGGRYFGEFEDETTVPPPPMRYTSYPDRGHLMSTLQFFSVKVASIDESLHWPLDVYGLFAIRDTVDPRRNMIFCRNRDNCQTVNQQDPYLALTGPSRAVVVSSDPSYFEINLKVKGSTEPEDKDLCSAVSSYMTSYYSTCFDTKLCTLEIECQEIETSVEATISVKVIDGSSWPEGLRGVFFARTDGIADLQVKLLECGDDKLPFDEDVDDDGGKMIRLTRRVVSVEFDGILRISAMAHPIHGGRVVRSRPEAAFVAKRCGTSSNTKFKVGSCRMEVTVAWSLFGFLPDFPLLEPL